MTSVTETATTACWRMTELRETMSTISVTVDAKQRPTKSRNEEKIDGLNVMVSCFLRLFFFDGLSPVTALLKPAVEVRMTR